MRVVCIILIVWNILCLVKAQDVKRPVLQPGNEHKIDLEEGYNIFAQDTNLYRSNTGITIR